MKITKAQPADSISLFVKEVLTFESEKGEDKTVLPFYADGYPGIMFQQTGSGLYVLPHNKQMPAFFLYGQTIHPIELSMQGQYQLIVFQLYPFVLESFFGVDPRTLNDGCYDLTQLQHYSIANVLTALHAANGFEGWTQTITAFLNRVFLSKQAGLDDVIRQAILLIVQGKGQHTIMQLREALCISERTFERRFLAQVGITPKQFSKIIQFDNSLTGIRDNHFEKLSDVVYNNGYADQSHFIRVFKAFTGITPSQFSARIR